MRLSELCWICVPVFFLPSCQDVISVGAADEGDHFLQQGGPVVTDVLWIIDNSGTMSEEQTTLEAATLDFASRIEQSGIDFHLAVITSDMAQAEEAGVLRGTPPYLTPDTEALAAEFLARASVGVAGSAEERGLDAASAALSSPLKDTANAGFLRPEAELDLIFVSDEDDQSDILLSEMVDFLARLKGSLPFRVSALVGDAPYGCASLSGAADPAPRYLELADATGGVTQSICSSSYGPMIERLVMMLSHLQDTFPLSGIPDPDSIEVEVDGVVLREREVDGWQYLPSDNAVRISGTPLPQPGQEIIIRWDPFRL